MSDRHTDRAAPLGRLIASYHAARPPSAWLYCSVAVGIAAFVACCHNVVQGSRPSAWLVASVCAFLLCGLWTWRRCRSRRVDLYQQGIVCVTGRRHRAMRWDQIGELYQVPLHTGRLPWQPLDNPSGWMYRLVGRDGRQLRLASLEGIRGLGHRMQDEIARHMVPVAIDAFRAGYILRFGRWLTVGDEGLHVGRKLLRWHEIADIAIDENRGVQVEPADNEKPPIRIPCAEVCNLPVLACVLDVVRSACQPDEDRPAPDDADGDQLLMPYATNESDYNVSELILAGYDWEDVEDVLQGECTLEELLARGPRHRPNHPR